MSIELELEKNASSLSNENQITLGKFIASLPIMEGKTVRASKENHSLAIDLLGEKEFRNWTKKFRRYSFKGVEN